MVPSARAASVIATVALPAACQPHGVAAFPRTNLVYVACTGGGAGSTVRVIDGATNTVTATVTVGGEPFGLALNPSTKRLYVANHASDTVSVVDVDPLSPGFHTVIATTPVGNEPEEFGSNPLTNRIYAVEFWYQPHYNHDDGVRHLIWFNQSGAAADFHCFIPEKNGANELRPRATARQSSAGARASYSALAE